MAGKRGMSKGKMGGAREGAGAPYKFSARKNEYFIFERETIGDQPFHKPELWVFNAIEENGNNLVFQCGNDIITIRRPEPGELVLGDDGT